MIQLNDVGRTLICGGAAVIGEHLYTIGGLEQKLPVTTVRRCHLQSSLSQFNPWPIMDVVLQRLGMT